MSRKRIQPATWADVPLAVRKARASRRMREGGMCPPAPFALWGTFDPRSISGLTGLYRNYTGSAPWTGTGSNFAAGVAPAAGTALDTRGVADFNGTSQFLTSASAASTYWGTSSLSLWIVFKCNLFNTNDTTSAYTNDALIATSGTNQFCVYLRSAGVVGVGLFNTSADIKAEASGVSVSTWGLVQATFNGSTLRVRFNGGTFSTQASAAGINSLAAALNMGKNSGSTTFFHGDIAEVGMANVIIPDTTFDQIRGYCQFHYGIIV